jgi:hypothetical protein
MDLFKLKWTGRVRDAYELLPPSNSRNDGATPDDDAHDNIHGRRPASSCLRSVRRIVSALVVVFILSVLYKYYGKRGEDSNPPLYEEYRQRERTLPQHNMSLPYPEGSHAKFLWAANHGECKNALAFQ